MKRTFHSVIGSTVIMSVIILLMMSLFALAQNQAPNVITDNLASASSNSLEDEKYKTREDEAGKYFTSDERNCVKMEKQARDFIREFPNRNGGYELMMLYMEIVWAGHNFWAERTNYDGAQAWGKAWENERALAKEMSTGAGPQWFKSWSQGFLNRLDAMGKPIQIQFKAMDGSEVDLGKMKGKVVLINFWATWCTPCVEELPQVKAAYDKFHRQGFEVIGVSLDEDKTKLERFLKQNGIAWPQYFDGKSQVEDNNKFAQEFGIDGIPHVLLVDKKGCLRVDQIHLPDGFEETVKKLLAE